MNFWFLIVLALVWIVAAVIQDFRKREIPNWLNFSLIAFALAYRAFYSVIFWDVQPIFYGLLGFGVFFVFAEMLYYSRVFAGGDAKLLMALGAVLPFSDSLALNLLIFGAFLFLLLFLGSVYGIVYSLVLVFSGKKKFIPEFVKQAKQKKYLFFVAAAFSLISLGFVFYSGELSFAVFPVVFILFPFLFAYAKTVEENYFIASVPAKDLTLGDWLYEEIIIGKKKLKPDWEGLTEGQLKLLQKRGKKVAIKQGIPFAFAFLLAFLGIIVLIFIGLMNWGI
jgi:Flp pilus assembly protein protease CpaA